MPRSVLSFAKSAVSDVVRASEPAGSRTTPKLTVGAAEISAISLPRTDRTVSDAIDGVSAVVAVWLGAGLSVVLGAMTTFGAIRDICAAAGDNDQRGVTAGLSEDN